MPSHNLYFKGGDDKFKMASGSPVAKKKNTGFERMEVRLVILMEDIDVGFGITKESSGWVILLRNKFNFMNVKKF